MCEEKEGVMRNAMTTRAPGGANNRITKEILKIAIEITAVHPTQGEARIMMTKMQKT